MSIRNRLIVVLGMHRSGTSALTHSLEVLGINLGENVHAPRHDNPKGFWEDIECAHINEDLLRHYGSSWNNFLPIAHSDFNDEFVDALKVRAIEYINTKLRESYGIWGFKDPRTCRLLGFWKEVFDALDCDVSYLIAIRNPMAVARSLLERDGIPERKSYMLWAEHMIAALRDTDGCRRLVVEYDNVLDKPYEQLSRISSALTLAHPDKDSVAYAEYRNSFLSEDLRHHFCSEAELNTDANASLVTKKLRALLLQLASDKAGFTDADTKNQIANLIADWEGYLPIMALYNEKVTEIEEQHHKFGMLEQALAEQVSQNAKLQEQHNKITAQLEESCRKAVSQETVIADYAAHARNLEIKRAQLGEEAAELNRQMRKMRKSTAWRLRQRVINFKKKAIDPLKKIFRSRKRMASSLAVKTHRWTLPISQPSEAVSDYVDRFIGSPLLEKPVRVICFYLPQFHAIPENNAWWGEGFTEWTNVRPAVPQFEGHYQPHVPDALGYYDLLDGATQKKQVELAKLYGIEGFCFYFYWFAGTRLLETPILNYLADPSLDLPFCLCWANENWSRRWDGLDSELLIAQEYSAEDDLAFIEYVSKYLLDPRYIRINGKPLLMVYRPNLLPDAVQTMERWRKWSRENGIGEIYLAYTQSFEAVDPMVYGMDAAIEFPPNNSAPPNITSETSPLAPDFEGTVYDWRIFVERSKNYQDKEYTLFRSVCPSWDNTARRKNKGVVFANSSPAGYEKWLANAVNYTVASQPDPEKRMIFVNAWNEWAEGAHLEPDQRYGYAWLQATRDALTANTCNRHDARKKILVVTHDCHPHGAQFLILETAKQLKKNGLQVSILALSGGRLFDDFAAIGPIMNAEDVAHNDLHSFLSSLRRAGYLDAITSTVVSGQLVPQLKTLGFRVLSLIHELPGVIREMRQEANALAIAEHADKIVFPAELVRKLYCEIAPVATEKVVIRPQGVLRKNPYKGRHKEAHQIICSKHNLPNNCRIVLSIGYADTRKGADLFVEIARQSLKTNTDLVFIWVGHADQNASNTAMQHIRSWGLQDKVLFVGFDRDPLAYYAAAAVYALPSREDPFPNVVLEAAEVGLPVVAFDGASGACDFVLEHGGRLARYLDVKDFAEQLNALLNSPAAELKRPVGSLQQYSLDLLHHLNGLLRISVIVPNYNYERHIEKRLKSILRQQWPVYELIVLDDASSDNSVKVIKEFLDTNQCDYQLHVNHENAGSVFHQWQKGLALSKGDILWIAEADDIANDHFLEELMGSFNSPDVVLAYSQSQQIDDDDKVLAPDYLDYTKDISAQWMHDYVRNGREEIAEALSIKNTIPNVSAVLFRRYALESAFNAIGEDLFSYKVAGDWVIYLHVLLQGSMFFREKSLNMHRRHTGSVTSSTQKIAHLLEVSRAQEIARTLVVPSDTALSKAHAYVEYLHEYFQIPEMTMAMEAQT